VTRNAEKQSDELKMVGKWAALHATRKKKKREAYVEFDNV
jgi:hypothetical protein